jgi:CBS domain-containing protein
MIVADVMTTPAVTIGPDETAKEALQLLDEHAVTSLPVVAHGHLVGVVSEADLIRETVPRDLGHHVARLAAEDPAAGAVLRVADVMTNSPLSVRPETDLAVATELLTSTGVKSLPVVDEVDRVVGVVSRRDVVHVLAREDDAIEAEVDAKLRLRGDWLVEVDDGVVTIEGPVTAAQRAYARATAYGVPGVRHVLIRS